MEDLAEASNTELHSNQKSELHNKTQLYTCIDVKAGLKCLDRQSKPTSIIP